MSTWQEAQNLLKYSSRSLAEFLLFSIVRGASDGRQLEPTQLNVSFLAPARLVAAAKACVTSTRISVLSCLRLRLGRGIKVFRIVVLSEVSSDLSELVGPERERERDR